MRNRIYIALEGPVGVGKTTLAKLLQPAFDAQLVLELGNGNPFLRDSSTTHAQCAFATQLFFLLDRYRQHNLVIPSLLSSHSVISDCIFARDQIFAHLGLRGRELKLYEQVYDRLSRGACTPDVIVYLQASPDVLLERLSSRGEDTRLRWSTDFLNNMILAYDNLFETYSGPPVLSVCTDNLNFIESPEHLHQLVKRIQSILDANGKARTQMPESKKQSNLLCITTRPETRSRIRERRRIRPVALCVFYYQDSILVLTGNDIVSEETFYRPLGGGIRFGEHSQQTIRREIFEEIGAEVMNLQYIGTLENVFYYGDHLEHEIAQVYEAAFSDHTFYERSSFELVENDGTPFKAIWKPLADFQEGVSKLYPEGLLELLRVK
jgi:deoxyguanosine kinase